MSDYDDYVDNLIEKYGKNKAMEILAINAGYRELPVDIDTFVEDDRFLGKSTDGGRLIYPGWRKTLREIFPDPFTSPYDIVVLTGCIGAGKSTFAKIAYLYCLHKMLCIDNPHKFYGHVPTTEYLLFTWSPVAATGADIIEGEAYLMMKESEWFTKIRDANDGFFPNRIGTSSGSRPSSNVGRAIFASIMTEVNFAIGSADTLDPMNNFNLIYRRMQSRFMYKGRQPYPIIIDSSISDDNDMVSQIKKNFKNARMRVYSYAIWEIKPRNLYSKDTFEVFCGDENIDPFIITPDDPTGDVVKSNPETAPRVIKVPMDFYAAFTSDLRTSIRDIAGVATSANSAFISSTEAINQCFTLPNPITKQIIRMGISSQYKDFNLTDYFTEDYWTKFKTLDPLFNDLPLEEKRKFKYKPSITHDTRPRTIHIDIGVVKDLTGIGCSYVDSFKKILRVDNTTGEASIVSEPVYHGEWTLYAGAAPNDEMPIYKIRDFMVDLRTRGMNIYKITCDGYQSRQLMQELKVLGFNCEYLSVDRSKDPYLALKRAILEGRYKCADNSRLKVEIRELIDTGHMIDHPDSGELGDGSKDGADGMAGSLWTLVASEGQPEVDDASSQYMELEDVYSHMMDAQSGSEMESILLRKLMGN